MSYNTKFYWLFGSRVPLLFAEGTPLQFLFDHSSIFYEISLVLDHLSLIWPV